MAIEYDGVRFDEGFKADIVVGGKVVLELTSVEHVFPVHHKRTLTYIILKGERLGMLINFGEVRM